MEAAEGQANWKWGWGVLLGVPAVFLAAYVYPLIPALGQVRVCAARMFLGVDCPGCGLIRSFASLAHGRLRASIDFHPLGVVIALWLVVLFARSVVQVACRKEFPLLLRQRSRDLLLAVFLMALLFQWAMKLILSWT